MSSRDNFWYDSFLHEDEALKIETCGKTPGNSALKLYDTLTLNTSNQILHFDKHMLSQCVLHKCRLFLNPDDNKRYFKIFMQFSSHEAGLLVPTHI